MSNREQTLRVLAEHRDRLTLKRAAVVVDYEKSTARKEKLAEVSKQRTLEYQSTPRGIAESMRQIELAPITNQPRPVLRALRRQHLAAEEVSAIEYQTRANRWGHTPGDGPVRGCQVGNDSGLQRLILEDRILGSYRLDPTVDTVRVRLFRDCDAGRLRTEVTVSAGVDLTLSAILSDAFSDRRSRTRLLSRLALDPLRWGPVVDAVAATSASAR